MHHMQSAQDQVRELLSEIVKTKPDIISTDHKWLTETLKEQYHKNSTNPDVDCNKEINGLANCLFWGIVDDIRHTYSKTLDTSDAKSILRQLVRDYGQQEDLARWCIESWCTALNKIVDLTTVGAVPISSSFPLFKHNIPKDSSFSEETFSKYVLETLKTKELDLETKLFLTVKGKQLELTDNQIESIYSKCSQHVAEFKKKSEDNRWKEQKQIEDEKLREINKIKEDIFFKTQEARRKELRQKQIEKEQMEERIRQSEEEKQAKFEAEENERLNIIERNKPGKYWVVELIVTIIIFILIFSKCAYL